MSWTRIRLDQIDHEEPSPLVITAPVGSDKHIATSIPLAGWWGSLKGNAWLRPVVFKPNGTVDFGGDPVDEANERVADMQIFGVAFELGSFFYLRDRESGDVSRFVVREMTPVEG